MNETVKRNKSWVPAGREPSLDCLAYRQNLIVGLSAAWPAAGVYRVFTELRFKKLVRSESTEVFSGKNVGLNVRLTSPNI